jgi:hypothetical protein
VWKWLQDLLASVLRPRTLDEPVAKPQPAGPLSQRAIDFIIAEEVSSKAVYEKRYRRPIWPGGGSGVTIGIGYDVGAGVDNFEQLHADWAGVIPGAMITILSRAIGVTGSNASALAAQMRSSVDIPWEAATAVYSKVTIPRYYAKAAKALPNFEELPADCKGALVSLVFNRGPSFSTAGDRYSEMRAIKAHMANRQFGRIPFELRSMARLWIGTSVEGVAHRREREA